MKIYNEIIDTFFVLFISYMMISNLYDLYKKERYLIDKIGCIIIGIVSIIGIIAIWI